MIFHDVDPLSKEWHTLRLGIPTSSEFSRIITPKTMKISASATTYMHQLLGEWITGESHESYQSEWMVRGQEVEDSIWKAYEGYTDQETSRGGFFTTDDGMIGCSPDRLVGKVGDLEAKAPMIHTQVGYALTSGEELQADYKCQVQGRMWIHGREWVDLFSWHPALFIPPLRVFRDQKFIDILAPVLKQFIDTMLEKRLELERKFGPFIRPEPEQIEESKDWLTTEDEDAIVAARFPKATLEYASEVLKMFSNPKDGEAAK